MTTNERVRARQTSNEARVLRAEAALNGYRKSVHRGYVPQRKDEADLRDLLTDLRHWAKAKGRAFRTELAKSRDYFRIEDAPAEPMRFDPCRGVSSIRAADAARQIALLLDGREWGGDEVDEVGAILMGAGFLLRSPDDVKPIEPEVKS